MLFSQMQFWGAPAYFEVARMKQSALTHPFSVIASGGTPRGNPALDDV
jgi:hypothetical protein